MDTLQSPQKILEEWRTDDFINKQYLCYELRRQNYFSNHYILKYNIDNYDWHAEQSSVSDREKNTIRLKTYLNKNKELVDLIRMQTEIEFDIDLTEKKLHFRLKYYFHRNANTESLRRKKAIVLETFSYKEFKNLVQYVGYGDFEKDTSYDYLGYFSKIYEFYFNQASTPEQLIFLYTNTPDFVFERMALDDEKVMQHLITLTQYDDNGFFSGWKDGSSALVNVFKASSPGYIMNRFRKEPELCNRIYYNLDGISYADGNPQSNRIIFAGIMRSFAQNHKIKEDVPIFKIKKGYRVNTKVTELSGKVLGLFGLSDEETFFLQQQQEQYIEVENYETDDLGVSTNAKRITQKTIYKDLDEGRQFLPLEMVYFEEEFDGITMITKVPAIYVKALADAEKWAIINDRLRIVADIAAIILGVGTLATTGNPYLLLAAATDLSLAIPDLTIQTFREEIKKLPGGEQFLKDWDLIYGIGGAIVAAPQLIVSFYRGIFVLLPRAVKNVQQGLKASAISVFLDLNSGRFERSQLTFLQTTEWVAPSCGSFDNISAIWLENIGAGFIEIANEAGKATKQEYMLVYKGLPVAKGNKYVKGYADLMRKVRQASYSEEKLTEVLEEAFDDTWKHFDKEPASGGRYPTTNLEKKYTTGEGLEFEKGVKYLTEKEREAYEVFVQYDKIVDAEGKLMDSTNSIFIPKGGKPTNTNMAIFVMSEEGKIYISKNYGYGKFHHSSFLEGKPISAGGEIFIEQGLIKEITNDSGHYMPGLNFVKENVLKELENRYYFISTNKKEDIKFNSNF